MKALTVVIERCHDTAQYVGNIRGIPGCHSQGRTIDELVQNLEEVLEMLLDGDLPNHTLAIHEL